MKTTQTYILVKDNVENNIKKSNNFEKSIHTKGMEINNRTKINKKSQSEKKHINVNNNNNEVFSYSGETTTHLKKKASRAWMKRYIPIFSSLVLAFIVSLILIFTLPRNNDMSNTENNVMNGFNTVTSENQAHNNGNWPRKVIAPFIDTTYWVPLTSEYSLSGVADCGKVADETGLRYFNFAFINPSSTTPTATDGTINWCWGGYDSLSKNSTSAQYKGIVQSMENVKNIGGDLTISVGGQLGNAPWVVSNNENKLYEMYKDIIDHYELDRLDLDIEESNQGEAQNKINAKAIKRIQDETGVDIILTIPIMPDGWKEKQLKVINAYLDAGVEISLINSMTMCYGYGVADTEDYGDASIRAMESANKQMIELYKSRGVELTESEAYARMGATVAIGYDSSLYPTFTSEMARKVAEHAKAKSYGMLSYWSVGRDAGLQANKGVNSKYEFLNQMYIYLG